MQINKTISLSKGEIKVSRKDNAIHIEYVGCNKNASTTNKIIEALQPIIDTMFRYEAKLNLGTFEEAQGNIRYGMSVHDTLLNLKKESCGYSSKLVEKLSENLAKIKTQLNYAVSRGKYTYPEKIVLGSIEEVGFDEMDEHSIMGFYNAKTLSLSRKMADLIDEVNSYNYKKYGLNKDDVTHYFNEIVKKFKNNVASFESLVNEHGDDLINWGSHKLTRRGVTEYMVRRWVDDYQETLIKKGIEPESKNKTDSVKKSRDSVNKTQDDFFRLFKSGTQKEAKDSVPNLSLENIKTLFTNPIKSVEGRIRENRSGLIKAFCNLDDGRGFNIVVAFCRRNHENCLPMSYLYKVVDTGEFDNKRILEMSRYNREEIHLMPDSFYNTILKDLQLSESLNMNYLFTDAILSRMSNDEIVNVIKRMAGMKGIFLLVGLDVADEDDKKMSVHLSKETVRRFDPAIYTEIKDFLFDVSNTNEYDEMIVANKDKEMAKKFLNEGEGRQEVLRTILTYKERLSILKSKITKGERTQLEIKELFTEQEQAEAFKDLLKMDDDFTKPYLESQWEHVKYTPAKKEYLKILESIPSKQAPLDYTMSKEIRLLLVENGVVATKDEVSDFTRKELEERGYTLGEIASIFPHLLTEYELVERGNNSDKFLKDHIELFPKAYLAHKFQDPEYRKEFIGNRTHRENRIANNKLERKLAE